MDTQHDQQGSLGRYELLALLRSLRAERFTGRLSLTAGDERVALLLLDGAPVYARSAALRHSYPAWLVRQQLLPRDLVKSVFRQAAEARRPFEEVLVEAGHLTPASLVATRQSLARYVLSFAFSLDPAVWTAVRTAHPATDLLRLDLAVDRAFFRFVAQRDPVEAQVAALRPRYERAMAPTASFGDGEAAFRAVFGAHDDVLEAARTGGRSVAGLLGAGLDEAHVAPRAFALHVAGMIRFELGEHEPDPWAEAIADLASVTRMAARAGRRRNGGVEDGEDLPTGALPLSAGDPEEDGSGLEIVAEDAPPPPPQAQTVDPRQAALAMLDEAERASHYSLLGVGTGADPAAVRDAAARVRARVEALRGREGLDDEAASALRAVAVRVDQAERTLTDDRRRKLYNDSRGIR